MTETIYVGHKPGIYKPYKTIGGWVVNYLDSTNTLRGVDGGKLYPHRQNAYARSKKLNTSLERALEKTGMAEATYYGGEYIANVEDDQGEFGDQFTLTFRKGEMPPFETKFFSSLEELKDYVFQTINQPLSWHKVTPEEI